MNDMLKKVLKVGSMTALSLALVACGSNDGGSSSSSSGNTTEDAADRPDTWIADRTIVGLVFQSAGDAGVDTISPEIAEYIKERTGITLELQTVTSEDSTQALVAGLAAGDLPDFISFYLNNSGRPEFPPLLQAANEGMFHDIAPYLKEGDSYSLYFEDNYLPRDTKENIMMRDEHDGATYLVHMSIARDPDQLSSKMVGGPFIRKDIAEDLGIDPLEITTSEQVYEVLQEIAEGDYTDANGAPVTPLGPTVWGGSERPYIYHDLVWTGDSGEKFWKDDEGIKHESMTDMAEKRVAYVQKLFDEGLMHPEFYTMEETRAAEGATNKSFGIISDIHSGRIEVAGGDYLPIGPINRVDGKNHAVSPYKSGYAGWAVPATTEAPEEVVAFADWLASPEGQLLYNYGLEGVHYELGEDGKPVPNADLVELKNTNPDEAKEAGFRGVGAYWGEHLGWTNLNRLEDFGEANWGDKLEDSTAQSNAMDEIAEFYGLEERFENREVIDGLTPRAYLYEFEQKTGHNLTAALDAWDEEMMKAYYANPKESQKIIDAAKQDLIDNGIEEYCAFLEEKEAEGEVIYF